MRNLLIFFSLMQICFICGQDVRDIILLDNDNKSDFRNQIDFNDSDIFKRRMFSSNRRFRLAASYDKHNVEIRDTDNGSKLIWNAGINTDYTVGDFTLDAEYLRIHSAEGSVFGPQTLWGSKFISSSDQVIEYTKRFGWAVLCAFLFQIPPPAAGEPVAELFFPVLGGAVGSYNFSHRYHNELKLSDIDGHIEIYHVDEWNLQNQLTNSENFPESQLIFSTRDNKHRVLHENFTSLKSFIKSVFPEYEIEQFLETDDEKNKKRLIMTPNEKWFLINGKIFSMANLSGTHAYDGEKNSVSFTLNPVIDLFGDIVFSASGGYFDINNRGEIEIKDLSDNSIKAIKGGSECIHIYEEDYHFYLEEDGNENPILKMYSKDKLLPLWHMNKDNNVICEFPIRGQTSLTTNQKMIQYNQNPASANELTYLLSADKTKLTIKVGNTIKVIDKSQFNGNFETSPALHSFPLN